LFTATGIGGMPVLDSESHNIGKAVEALVECATGTVNYIVVATGGLAGIDEQLRAVPRSSVEFACDRLRLKMEANDFDALEVLRPGSWPAEA
jgi:predicted metal-dependent phosphotriesterase family hydrolase